MNNQPPRGPINRTLDQFRKFRLYATSDVRTMFWGMAIVGMLAAIGFVTCVLFELC